MLIIILNITDSFASPHEHSMLENNTEVMKKQPVNRKSSKDSYYNMLYDKREITKVADSGDQPFVKILSNHFKLLYVVEGFNTFQMEHLVNFMHR